MVTEAKAHELIVSVSPHARGKETVGRIMWTVNLSLLPAFIMSVYYFGPLAAYVTGLCILSAVLSEHIYQVALKKKTTIGDGTAFLTGLLLGMNLPPSVPFYIPIIGSIVAIVITKLLFGGIGYNVFNPALIGRAFLLISFPKLMTIWSEPTAKFVALDAKTTATPLGILKEEGMAQLMQGFADKADLYTSLLMGSRAGSLGETSVIALLIGAGFLLYRGYITWHIPVSFLATVWFIAWTCGGNSALFTGDLFIYLPSILLLVGAAYLLYKRHITWLHIAFLLSVIGLFALIWFLRGKGALFTGDPLIHILSGGLMLGAFFMATDYVTCPSVREGQIIFGIGCGAITMMIRLLGGFPEGVMFAILLMNCFAPLIDRSVKPKMFGAIKEQKEQAK